MYHLFPFILISISPLSPSQSIILMAQCVSVYLYVLMQMGIVLYACIFKLYKCCVIDFMHVLLFFMSSAFKIHLCCYVYIYSMAVNGCRAPMVYIHYILPSHSPGTDPQDALTSSPSPQITLSWVYMSPLPSISSAGVTGSEGVCILNLMKSCLITLQNASTSPLPLEIHGVNSLT